MRLELKKSYHPKILLLGTVGKNLGTREVIDGDDEFRDTKIFKSVFKYLVAFSEKHKNQIQLFVVNKDYTDSIKDSDIVVQFDEDGTRGYKYGVIDDIIS